MITARTASFPPLDGITAPGAAPSERDFLRFEFEPGLDYYLNRLDRLLLSGDSLLDAGCGAGQWSIAASYRFQQVSSIDVNELRLETLRRLAASMAVTNIDVQAGSIEQLPYPDEWFDAVMCYGVIMFTNVQQSLAEFHRVLRPGGRVYICLNGDGWSRHLIQTRVTDERAQQAGRLTLYNAHWRRALESGIETQLSRVWAQWQDLAAAVNPPDSDPGDTSDSPVLDRAVARRCLLSTDTGAALLGNVTKDCGDALVEILLDDTLQLTTSSTPPPRRLSSDAFHPDELRQMAEAIGFRGFEWSTEAGLVCDWLKPNPTPKYAGWFDGDLAVWEAMLVKPASRTLRRVDPNQHLAAARLARDERLFLEPAERTILSNGNQESYPVDLVAHAQLVGEHLGGQQYLKALAQTIVKSARNEQDAACRLIVFVQRSIFRDPVSQPLTRDGGTPDSLTTLLSARGRCSHTASLLVDVFGHAGLQARMRQLTNHVIAEVLIDGRWVIADADVFKNGVIPVNRSGEMLSMDDLEANPYQIDRFPPTGWWIRPGTRFTLGAGGGVVEGYVDALDSDERGFVSGYYVPVAQGYPPPVPVIRQFRVENGRVLLEWSSSKRGDAPVWYRVRVGTTSRAWTYDDPGDADEVLRSTAADVVDVEIDETRLEHAIDAMAPQLYASVTAVNDRVQLEPDTFFWPSEEATFVE